MQKFLFLLICIFFSVSSVSAQDFNISMENTGWLQSGWDSNKGDPYFKSFHFETDWFEFGSLKLHTDTEFVKKANKKQKPIREIYLSSIQDKYVVSFGKLFAVASNILPKQSKLKTVDYPAVASFFDMYKYGLQLEYELFDWSVSGDVGVNYPYLSGRNNLLEQLATSFRIKSCKLCKTFIGLGIQVDQDLIAFSIDGEKRITPNFSIRGAIQKALRGFPSSFGGYLLLDYTFWDDVELHYQIESFDKVSVLTVGVRAKLAQNLELTIDRKINNDWDNRVILSRLELLF